MVIIWRESSTLTGVTASWRFELSSILWIDCDIVLALANNRILVLLERSVNDLDSFWNKPWLFVLNMLLCLIYQILNLNCLLCFIARLIDQIVEVLYWIDSSDALQVPLMLKWIYWVLNLVLHSALLLTGLIGIPGLLVATQGSLERVCLHLRIAILPWHRHLHLRSREASNYCSGLILLEVLIYHWRIGWFWETFHDGLSLIHIQILVCKSDLRR